MSISNKFNLSKNDNRLLVKITEWVKSTRSVSEKDIKLVWLDFGKEEMLANGDRELLRQVFPNLIRNAIQAMPEGGELRIRTRKALISVPENDGGSVDRRFIAVTITDTGGGISAEDLEKIFNPFFTTKEKGTGLGLAISHNIIKAHQGTIDAVSEEGKGTSFTVKIPCWDEGFDEK